MINKKTFQYGDHTVVIETGGIARQATGAVLISMDDTVVLVTAVGVEEAKEHRDFFPLTVNYQERFYSAGKLPGGFFKREGRPTIKETLTSRLIDRPIRPLFPKGFLNEVQVVATVMSMDPEINADIPALIGASAALAISGMPFNGPIAAARVGFKDGSYLLNPTAEQLEESSLDLVVAGTKNAVLMVESEAKELTEEEMLGAVMFGHEQMQVAINAIEELVAEAGKPKWDWQPAEVNEKLEAQITKLAEKPLTDAYAIKEKPQRRVAITAVHDDVIAKLITEDDAESPEFKDIKNILEDLEKKIVRGSVIAGKTRIDGRGLADIRPITTQVGLFPRTHGSALFTRGETQAIVTTTLTTERGAQIIDLPSGEGKEMFMLHYNFPPYCVGEVGFMTGPKRREYGHGNLAKRALMAIMPSNSDFPYAIRVVSEITESNGSSSMASVCGGCLSLMDAGVPVKAPVAGIAMGLIKEGKDFAVLSDILGDEDHLGDMDFKVAGTADGINALQMDIKIDGITKEIMSKALEQAKAGRMHILGIMEQTLASSRPELSARAPRITTIKINPDKIRDVIGKGGAVIRDMIERIGVEIDINDDGEVKIAAVDNAASEAAIKEIEAIVADPEVGKIYAGKVVKIMDFGAFVNIMPKTDGLVHISQIADERVEKVTDKLTEGQDVQVKLLEIDRQGRLKLTMRNLEE